MQRFSEIAVMSSHGAAVNRYLAYDKFTFFTMPANSTSYECIGKFDIIEQQKFCCVWDNGHVFLDNFEEPLCQWKPLIWNLISNIKRIYLPQCFVLSFHSYMKNSTINVSNAKYFPCCVWDTYLLIYLHLVQLVTSRQTIITKTLGQTNSSNFNCQIFFKQLPLSQGLFKLPKSYPCPRSYTWT